jgi:inosine-uridine nucleoside N-ribohydrolase
MRLVIDTDPGNGVPGADVDDGLAIGLALRSPEVELEAVTVVAGNVEVDRGVQCALELLELAGAAHVPVHPGAAHPLMQDPAGWRRRLDLRRDDERAQALWHGMPAAGATRSADALPAAQALVDLADRHPGELTVLAIGPLTNVATAMLLDPEWAGKLARLVIMGGAFGVPDVIQELNFAYDPEATQIVLASVAPKLIVPLDVTLRTFMRLEHVDRLEAAGTPLATHLGRTSRPWITWLAERFGRDGCALHDPLALAALLEPAVVGTRTAAVGMELRGSLTRGRVVSWRPQDEEILVAGLDLPDVPVVQIAETVDNDRFVALLLDRLTAG